MENSVKEEEILKYNKRFGKVTTDYIEIYGGSNPMIDMNNVDKVKLVKTRIFYSNFAFLAVTLFSAYLIYEYFDMDLTFLAMLFVFSLTTFVFTFVHKFYRYTVVIKLNNKEVYTMRATPFHRKCIKEFYYAIYERINKSERLVTVAVQKE